MHDLHTLNMLEGLCELRQLDLESFEARCLAMKQEGYDYVYFSDLFFTMEPVSAKFGEDRVLWVEGNTQVVARSLQQLEAIQAVLERTKLRAGGAHFLQSLPADGQPPETIAPLHRRLVQLASAVGVSRITTHAGWRLPGGTDTRSQDNDAIYEESLRAYRTLCNLAADHGIVVTIETACQSWSWLDEHPERLVEFINHIGMDNLGVCFDSGHSHIVGLDLGLAFREMRGLVRETHYHDNYGRPKNFTKPWIAYDLHNPIGDGSIDWLPLIEAMCDMSYAGVITFEQNDFSANAREWRKLLSQMKDRSAVHVA